MRAILAALIVCLFAVASPASAHSYRPHVHPMVAGLGIGLAHMLRSADRHSAVHHAAHYRRRYVRPRRFAQPREAMRAAFVPFEPAPELAPFSMLFGASETVVNAGVGIGFGGLSSAIATAHAAVRVTSHVVSRIIGYRPAGCGGIPWCGCYMRRVVGRDPGPAYNLARNWAHYGRPTYAHVGAIVVWPHHVGRIVGRTHSGEFIVLSGNDGHAVRERARSLAGAIAFRE